MHEETLDGTMERPGGKGALRPGLIAIFSGNTAAWVPLPLIGGAIVVGRAALPADPRLSRAHAEVTFDGTTWKIRDLGSRNGTSVDGQPVQGIVSVQRPRVVRVADTILLPVEDIERAEPSRTERGMIIGASLARALDGVARAAEYSRTLVLNGESGSGKELAAHEFHERGPHAGGPFIAVNCATIPQGLAERLLFGAKRGAYSGADADATGYLAAADQGVLFLDEVAELDLQAQAKLLRAIETGDVLPLGAQRSVKVSVRVCVATHRKLREEAAAGRFREDLYFRLAPPEVVLPPLRERPDELVAHIFGEISRGPRPLAPHPSLIETCLLRMWPGNVRELRKQLRQAVVNAAASPGDRVRVDHLAPTAGIDLAPAAAPEPADAAPGEPDEEPRKRSYIRWSESLTREQIERALADNRGNVSGAARSLGMNRSQLYREMARCSMGTGSSGADPT